MPSSATPRVTAWKRLLATRPDQRSISRTVRRFHGAIAAVGASGE